MEFLGWIALVVAGVIVAFFLLSIVVFLALQRRVRQIGAALEAAVGSDLPRYRARLAPLSAFEWHDEPASERAVTQLAAARFSEAGRYTLAENASARLVGMANEGESLFAVIYELGPTGPRVDITGRYDDGRRLTVTDVADTGLDEPDDRVTLRYPGADAATLAAKARDERPAGTLVAVQVDGFAAAFEEAYAAEMDWRATRGGFNRSEITHAAHLQAAAMESDEIRVDDATVDLMLSTFNAALFDGVDAALRERLEASTGLSIVEWEEVRDRLVFVYDNLPTRLLRRRLASCLAGVSGPAGERPGGDAGERAAADAGGHVSHADVTDRESFAAALEAAPVPTGAGRPRLLATVDEPFAADVYVAAAATPPD